MPIHLPRKDSGSSEKDNAFIKIRTARRMAELKKRDELPHWRIFTGDKDSRFVVIADTEEQACQKAKALFPKRGWQDNKITAKRFQTYFVLRKAHNGFP